MKMTYDSKRIKDHWNKLAQEGDFGSFNKIFPLEYAGMYADYNMQHLEMESILKYLKEEDKVLDIGCGKGYSTLYMAWKKNIDILGMDYAEEMINGARNNLNSLKEKNKFLRGLVVWTGFKQVGIPFERQPRFAGESKADPI